jgi:hypothetical protein
MRWITQLLICILLIISLYIGLTPVLRELWLQSNISNESPEKARASSYFPLSQDKWLTFEIANQSRLFRFYFHAALRPNKLDTNLSYEIQYQWLDSTGMLIAENIYHINTRHSPFLPVNVTNINPVVDTKNNNTNIPTNIESSVQPLSTRFYNHNRSEPSVDQSLYLSPAEHPTAKKIRFRVHAMNMGINEIGLRSYIQYHRDDKDIQVAWQRMSREQRQAISNASVYPSFLLSEHERYNIMRAYWKPIGPLGVLDKDYRIETLYIRESTVPTLPQTTIVNEGVFVSPKHWLTLKLESPSKRYRIQWNGIHPLQPDIPNAMQLHWQDENVLDQRRWQANVKLQIWEGELSEGLLQVIPNKKGILKFYQLENNKWQDITPNRLRSRAYVCTPNTPLHYSMAPGEEIQPIKINARGFYRHDKDPILKPIKVSLNIRSNNERILIQDSFNLKNNPNPYQQFKDTALIDSHIFEPVYRYIDASRNSNSLNIKCSAPTLISVSTRPWQHPISRALPRDKNYWHAYPVREPAWFSLQPKGVQQLIANNQYHSLIWNLQPINTNTLVSSGDFSWQALNNQNPDTLEKQLFSHHESNTTTRMEARASSYQAIKGSQKVIFSGKNAQAQLRPSAVYLRDTPQPQLVQVLIDDKPILKITVVGENGKVRLPSLKSGTHKIEFRSKGEKIQWFVNNTAQSKRSHLLRSAYPLLLDNLQPEESPLIKKLLLTNTSTSINKKIFSVTLPFNISGEGQQLALWLFAPTHSTKLQCTLSVQSQRLAGSQESHSFRHYKYDITTEKYPLSHVLKQKMGRVHGPIPLFVKLDKDLPSQDAHAKLSCNQPNVLASAGIISAGVSSSYDFRERINAQ